MSTLLVINDQKRLGADSVTQLIQHKNTRFQSKRPNLHLLVHQLNIPWAEFIPNSTFNFYRTMSGGKRYALKDYPASESKHSPTRNFDHVSSISAYLSVCLSVCLQSSTRHLFHDLPHKHHTEALWRLPPDSNRLYSWTQCRICWCIFLRGMGLKVGMVVLGLGGGAGYGAKWKHVTQGPLKRNPAHQKKETHIIIKSSQGKVKTTNIIPTPPHILNTHVSAHSSRPFPAHDGEDRMIGPTVFAHCLRVTRRRFLISQWFGCFLEMFFSRGSVH